MEYQPNTSNQIEPPQVVREPKPPIPLLVKIMGWIMLIKGVGELLLAFFLLLFAPIIGMLGLFFAVGLIITSFGIRHLKQWALYAFTGITTLAVGAFGYSFLVSTEVDMLSIGALVLQVLFLIYFWSIAEKFGIQEKRKSIIIAMIILVFMVIGSGGIFAWQYFWAPEEKAPKEEVVKDETADWKTYRNEEYGFEVKHPAGWTLRVRDTVDPTFEFSGEEGIFVVLPRGLEVPPFRRLGQGELSNAQLTQEDEGRVVEYKTQEGEVLGYSVRFNIVPTSWEERFGSLNVQVKVEDVREYQHEGLEIPISAEVSENNVELIIQILSTFRFLE